MPQIIPEFTPSGYQAAAAGAESVGNQMQLMAQMQRLTGIKTELDQAAAEQASGDLFAQGMGQLTEQMFGDEPDPDFGRVAGDLASRMQPDDAMAFLEASKGLAQRKRYREFANNLSSLDDEAMSPENRQLVMDLFEADPERGMELGNQLLDARIQEAQTRQEREAMVTQYQADLPNLPSAAQPVVRGYILSLQHGRIQPAVAGELIGRAIADGHKIESYAAARHAELSKQRLAIMNDYELTPEQKALEIARLDGVLEQRLSVGAAGFQSPQASAPAAAPTPVQVPKGYDENKTAQDYLADLDKEAYDYYATQKYGSPDHPEAQAELFAARDAIRADQADARRDKVASKLQTITPRVKEAVESGDPMKAVKALIRPLVKELQDKSPLPMDFNAQMGLAHEAINAVADFAVDFNDAVEWLMGRKEHKALDRVFNIDTDARARRLDNAYRDEVREMETP